VEPRTKIFISYRRSDTGGVAGRLFDTLKGQFGRNKVFLDSDGIDAGERFTKRLRTELGSAAVLLVLVGKNWLKQFNDVHQRRIDLEDDWVRREIEIGLREEIRIIPLLVDGADMPGQKAGLDPSISDFCEIQAEVLRNNYFDTDVGILIDQLKEYLPDSDNSALDPSGDEALVGDRIGERGRFELLALLGSGGFGSVYQATDHGLTQDDIKKEVAVKVLHANLSNDEISRRRFYSGASAMDACTGIPYVVDLVHHAAVDEKLGRHYFVMEYVKDGRDLWDWASGRRHGWKDIIEVIDKVAAGISAVFEQRELIHRDIKPRNILLTGDPVIPKITDFDLVLNKDSRKTRAGPLGTFLFSSPEALLDGSEADQRSDVYSLAMTTVFCFHGDEIPMEAIRDLDNFLLHLDCPEPFKRVLRKGLAQRPEHRQQSAAEFRQELDDARQRMIRASAPPPVQKVVEPTSILLEPGGDLELNMLALPEGEFLMGSPLDEPGRGSDEVQHSVKIASFWISSTPTTRALWNDVMSWDTRFPDWGYSDADHKCLPVHGVSWSDSLRFLNALSILFGLEPCYCHSGNDWTWTESADGFRLPTEAEWEYAARAGGSGSYPAHTSLDEQAWHLGNSDRRPHPVALLKENSWGLFDMSGNVWEWVWDRYGEYPDHGDVGYSGPEAGDARVIRGGGNRSADVELRCAHRDRMNPEVRDADFGFRCVRGSVQAA
jgi:formylglycine-generating enzyme required for sulfatase activity